MKFTLIRITRSIDDQDRDVYSALMMFEGRLQKRNFANQREMILLVNYILRSKNKAGIDTVHRLINSGGYEFFGDLLDLSLQQAELLGWNGQKQNEVPTLAAGLLVE